MRLAILADIHGNLPALETVLADARRQSPDAWLCLGDVASTGPQPRACLEALRQLGCPVVMGNADEELISPRPFTPRGLPDERELFELDAWAREQLTPDDQTFLRSFQPTVELDLGGFSLLAFHGSPAGNRDEIGAGTPEARLAALRAEHGQQTLWVGGHTHQALLRQLNGWTLLNPGSVGLPFERRGERYVNMARAEYLLLDVQGGQLQTSFRRLPYDVQAIQAAFLASGAPHAGRWAQEWVPA